MLRLLRSHKNLKSSVSLQWVMWASFLIDHTRLSQTFYRPASPAESMLIVKAVDQHDALITAIEAQEPTLAIDLTLQHWDLSRDRMERYVRPDPLPVDVVSLKDRQHAV